MFDESDQCAQRIDTLRNTKPGECNEPRLTYMTTIFARADPRMRAHMPSNFNMNMCIQCLRCIRRRAASDTTRGRACVRVDTKRTSGYAMQADSATGMASAGQ